MRAHVPARVGTLRGIMDELRYTNHRLMEFYRMTEGEEDTVLGDKFAVDRFSGCKHEYKLISDLRESVLILWCTTRGNSQSSRFVVFVASLMWRLDSRRGFGQEADFQL